MGKVPAGLAKWQAAHKKATVAPKAVKSMPMKPMVKRPMPMKKKGM